MYFCRYHSHHKSTSLLVDYQLKYFYISSELSCQTTYTHTFTSLSSSLSSDHNIIDILNLLRYFCSSLFWFEDLSVANIPHFLYYLTSIQFGIFLHTFWQLFALTHSLLTHPTHVSATFSVSSAAIFLCSVIVDRCCWFCSSRYGQCNPFFDAHSWTRRLCFILHWKWPTGTELNSSHIYTFFVEIVAILVSQRKKVLLYYTFSCIFIQRKVTLLTRPQQPQPIASMHTTSPLQQKLQK